MPPAEGMLLIKWKLFAAEPSYQLPLKDWTGVTPALILLLGKYKQGKS